MSAINSQHDLSGSVEDVLGACTELTVKSKDVESALASLDVTERAFLDALTHASVRRSHVIKEFASLLETARHDYQTIEHRSIESLKKISLTMNEERVNVAAALDKVHAAHVEIARWTNTARTELSHLEKTIFDNSTRLSHISDEVGHAYLGVYTATSHVEGDVVEGVNQCRTFLSDAVQQMASHCAQMESAIQQSAETLCHALDEQATGFATHLQQLTKQELSSGITSALDLAQRGLQENVKAVIEQAAGEVNASVQDGRSRADSHRQSVLNVFLPTDGNVKELDDVFKPLGDLVDRVGDLARNIGFLG
jgi:hypothetical protein